MKLNRLLLSVLAGGLLSFIAPGPSSATHTGPIAHECSDGLDNDNDLAIDTTGGLAGGIFPVGPDPQCASPQDISEAQPGEQLPPGDGTTPPTQEVRPGKGCGDKNHVHEREAACKKTRK